MKFTPNLTKTEFKNGLIAMIVTFFILPNLLAMIPALSVTELNFYSYSISAATAVACLRRYLGRNILAALDHPFATLYFAVLGYLANLVIMQMADYAAYLLLPDYVNYNNQAIVVQLSTDLYLMLATTVVLAPIVEECVFRGLLFRGLYDRSPVAAWVASVGLFAAIHVVSFIGVYSPLELVVSLLMYVPAGVILCVTYRRSGNIIAPIITHAVINLMASAAVLR